MFNIVQGNSIGTGLSGDTALGNGLSGVTMIGARENVIGGTTAATGNLIANNGQDGISIFNSTDGPPAVLNQIIGNTIEMNAESGVSMGDDVNGNVIGGKTKGLGNAIISNASNAGYGVDLGNGQNSVLGNSIALNNGGGTARGILSPATDPLTLDSAEQKSGKTNVKWTLVDQFNPPGTAYRIEFFSNSAAATAQGETYLGKINARLGDNNTATGVASVAKFPDHITATATLLDSKGVPVVTSAFSNVLENPSPLP